MNDTHKKRLFAFFDAFFPISQEEKEDFFAEMHLKHYRPGDCFIRPGEVCNHVFFLSQGLFKFYQLIDGQIYIREFFSEGQFYSEYESFLTLAPATYYIEALEDAYVLLIHRNFIHKGYDENKTWERFGRIIAEYLFLWLSQRISSFLLQTPEQRYQYLVENRPGLLQRVPQYMIASYLGVTPEALSRIRKRMAESKRTATG